MNENKKNKNVGCCGPNTGPEAASCCRIEALVPIDARGQIVLPKDVRDRAEISPGDKLAVVSFEFEGKVCCITLVKSDAFAESVKSMLGPMMTEILQD